MRIYEVVACVRSVEGNTYVSFDIGLGNARETYSGINVLAWWSRFGYPLAEPTDAVSNPVVVFVIMPLPESPCSVGYLVQVG